MDPEKKLKIKEAITEYLKTLGWPNIPNSEEFVFNQIEAIFRHLLSLNLVSYVDWEPYYLAASSRFQQYQVRKWMGF
jgi:hypothetical protein